MQKTSLDRVKLEDTDHFTPLAVSTTTSTVHLFNSLLLQNVHIIDVAKYLPIDNHIIGIKLVYASGHSVVLRGSAKLSKKRNDFYNQVTFTVALRDDTNVIASCKLFHNGTLHITGTREPEQTLQCAVIILQRLRAFRTVKMVELVPKLAYIKSFDHLLYSIHGETIGWSYGSVHYLYNEYVAIELFDNTSVFCSVKWNDSIKNVYSLAGIKIATKTLEFYSGTTTTKRQFVVKFGYIYLNNKIIGKEVIDRYDVDVSTSLDLILTKGHVVHAIDSFVDKSVVKIPSQLTLDQIHIHMINTFFKAPYGISRVKLHQCFLDNGYLSRFDPCSNNAVNLRFHYHVSTNGDLDQCGKCPNVINQLMCTCKDISISFFSSGKMNVTGLTHLDQGKLVYSFLQHFFTRHKSTIISTL